MSQNDGNFEITCPCCEATLVVERLSGEVLLHRPKERKSTRSLEEMVTQLQSQKSDVEKKFEKELAGQKDRARLLEERFREAMARADKNGKPINPMDLD